MYPRKFVILVVSRGSNLREENHARMLLLSLEFLQFQIENAVDSKRLSWDDRAKIRLKSVTHFSHADLRVQNSTEAKSMSRNSKYTGQPKEVRNGYCEPWNDFNNCTCSPSDPKYKDTHLCKICDNDHPKLSCPFRRFPIKTGKITP